MNQIKWRLLFRMIRVDKVAYRVAVELRVRGALRMIYSFANFANKCTGLFDDGFTAVKVGAIKSLPQVLPRERVRRRCRTVPRALIF
jgi:hypothetical protein